MLQMFFVNSENPDPNLVQLVKSLAVRVVDNYFGINNNFFMMF